VVATLLLHTAQEISVGDCRIWIWFRVSMDIDRVFRPIEVDYLRETTLHAVILFAYSVEEAKIIEGLHNINFPAK